MRAKEAPQVYLSKCCSLLVMLDYESTANGKRAFYACPKCSKRCACGSFVASRLAWDEQLEQWRLGW